MKDAHVACRMMGAARAVSYCSSNREVCSSGSPKSFASGYGKIWLDALRCTGYEMSLFNCVHAGFGDVDCVAAENMGVVCESKKNFMVKL